MTGEGKKRKSLLEFAGTWEADDIDDVFNRVKKDRKRSASRTVEIAVAFRFFGGQFCFAFFGQVTSSLSFQYFIL
jgi:hypothetical protein